MNQCWLAYCSFILLLVITAFAAQGSVSIENTRVIYPASAPEVTVRLHNNSVKPVLLQGWIDEREESTQENAYAPPFILMPPISRIEGQRGQTLRIHPIDVRKLPKDRESLLWINVLDVPVTPTNARDHNLMVVALHSRIKLFFRPEGLSGSPAAAAQQLRWQTTPNGVLVTNPSAWHVSLVELITPKNPKNNYSVDMVSPGTSRLFSIVLAAGTRFKYSWLDDHGTMHVNDALME